jgi:hypothetical protein
MGKLYEMYATNRKAEVEGVIIDIGEGTTFRLARRTRSNKRYTKALDVATKPHAIALEKETISPELSDQIMLDVFCETILLDWTGVEYDERIFGKIEPYYGNSQTVGRAEVPQHVEFSVENAKLLMKALPDLYDDLSKQSQKHSLYRDKQDEDDTKA